MVSKPNELESELEKFKSFGDFFKIPSNLPIKVDVSNAEESSNSKRIVNKFVPLRG